MGRGPKLGEAEPGLCVCVGGYWPMGGWDSAGTELRGATALPEGRGEGGAMSGAAFQGLGLGQTGAAPSWSGWP